MTAGTSMIDLGRSVRISSSGIVFQGPRPWAPSMCRALADEPVDERRRWGGAQQDDQQAGVDALDRSGWREFVHPARQIPHEGIELTTGTCLQGQDHTFFEFGQRQPADRVVVSQPRLDAVALGVRGS
ncbi:hypothetical protein QR77_05620 [Streptomyces sp. 150FB]|nr:hypothetical protein QR77_05620 [Streptomyces sp. 150FB]